MLLKIDSTEKEDDIECPSYDKPGRMLVEVGETDSTVYSWEYDVVDADTDTSVHWIEEGVGFDYWLDEYCTFPGPGTYLIEGIVGQYHRGDWAWGEDDDETWTFERITPTDAKELTELVPPDGNL